MVKENENKMSDFPALGEPQVLTKDFVMGKSLFFTPTKYIRTYYNRLLLLSAYYVPNVMPGAFYTLSLMLTPLLEGGEGYSVFHRRNLTGSAPCPSSHGQDVTELKLNLQRPNKTGQQLSPHG